MAAVTASSDLTRGRIIELLEEVEARAEEKYVRVKCTVLRRLCQMALRAHNQRTRDAAAAAACAQREREMAEAAILAGSNAPDIRERAEAIRRKHLVDAEVSDLKKRIGAAKANAHERGVYLPAAEFRKLEARLLELQNESQALQVRLGELRRAEKERNRRQGDDEHRAFKRIARLRLTASLFDAIELEAADSLDGKAAQ